MRISRWYPVMYGLLCCLAFGLLCHGLLAAYDNRPGTHHEIYPDSGQLASTNPILIRNNRLLADLDEKLRKSDFKQALWEISIGVPFLAWTGKMALTMILFNRGTPPSSDKIGVKP